MIIKRDFLKESKNSNNTYKHPNKSKVLAEFKYLPRLELHNLLNPDGDHHKKFNKLFLWPTLACPESSGRGYTTTVVRGRDSSQYSKSSSGS